MSRFGRYPRWVSAALLAGAIGLGAAGCVAVPVGGYGYGGYPEPAVVFPAPGVVITPPPVIYRDHYGYGRRGYGGRHYGDSHYGRGHWNRGHYR